MPIDDACKSQWKLTINEKKPSTFELNRSYFHTQFANVENGQKFHFIGNLNVNI